MNALREVQLRYESLILHNPDGIFEVDLAGRILHANPACEAIFGFTLDELSGMGLTELIDLPNTAVSHGELSAQIGVLTAKGESVWHHKDGRTVQIQHKQIPILIDSNLTGFHVVVKDVSEEFRQRHELLLAKEQLQIIHDSVDIAVWASEYPAGRVTYVSPGAERIWGIPLETLQNDASAWYKVMHPNDVVEVRKKMRNLIENREPMIHDYRVIHPSGSIRWVHDRTIPIVSDDGTFVRVVGVAVDITPVKLADEERIEALQALQRSDTLASLGQLAAGIAHEIRNPLATLRGFVQLAEPLLRDRPSHYNIMLSELDRINAIVSEFLSIAKPKTGSMEPQDVRPMIIDTATFLEGQALLHNISIAVDLDEELPPVPCNTIQLKQVFLNLMKNAIEAMSAGGQIQVVAKTTTENEVSVCITDEGSGIPPELLARLGDPFVTTKANGVGLGLLVTQQIVRNHGGRLHIESEVNRGTSISVILPTEFVVPEA